MTLSATYAIGEVSHTPSYYRAEQYDSDLGLYYLRARYYNPLTGRFLSRDPQDGVPADPKTLHKYLYAGGDPVNALDPTGRDDDEEYADLTFKQAAKVVLYAARVVCWEVSIISAAVKLLTWGKETGFPWWFSVGCAGVTLANGGGFPKANF